MKLSATEFNVDERDLQFVLFEQLKIQNLQKHEKFADYGEDDYRMILSEAVKFAKTKVAPLAEEGDKEGCTFDNGNVKVPAAFNGLFREFSENGWNSVSGNPVYGGMGLPGAMKIGVGELFTGANCAFSLYSLLISGAAHVINGFGSDEMKEKYLPRLYSGEYGATMVLTEPNAGSDLGNTKATAVKVDDYYKIRGSKIFITGGEHNLAGNIIHLVLARVKGAPEGTKGLSLFLVPKFIDGENGAEMLRNDLVCTGIEHKMGINGSATCSMSFGDNDECKGWVIGNEGEGLKIMFNMMNEARLDCGVQGESQGYAAYLNALAYTHDRYQGTDITGGKNAPRTTIINHPDVRDMLARMKSIVEAMRSMLITTGYYQDMKVVGNEEERQRYKGYEELVTPIMKGWCSDRGFEVCSLAVQSFGGYGYTAEYPVERLMRDTRIASIYEGTNGIQAMDLLGRKFFLKKGAVFNEFCGEMNNMIAVAQDYELLSSSVKAAKEGVDLLKRTVGILGKRLSEAKVKESFLFATSMLKLFGHVLASAHLLNQAGLAASKLKEAGIDISEFNEATADAANTSEELRFMWGKLVNAQYFCSSVLPEIEALAKVVATGNTAPLMLRYSIDT